MRRRRCLAPIPHSLALAASLASAGCAGAPTPRLAAAANVAPSDATRPGPAAAPAPAAGGPGATDFTGWWNQQSRREAEERFWNDPRERRRALSRDQFELWDRQRDRRLGRPAWPF